MKKTKKILNDKINKLNKYDLIIFIIIVLITSVFSLHKLGNMKSPNTFYRFNEEEIIVDLKDSINVSKISLYSG